MTFFTYLLLYTFQFWSLEQRRCSQTIIQTSLCNDLAVCLTASTVVSGHFDKKIRFWDANSCQMARETTLSGRITGLDVSNGAFIYLIVIK